MNIRLTIAKLVTVAIVAVILSWSMATFKDYVTIPGYKAGPGVLDLGASGIAWDIKFATSSPLCDGVPCLVTRAEPATSYTRQLVLPAHEFPLHGYKKGEKVYCRLNLERARLDVLRDEPLVLHSLYNWATSYELYINGLLIDRGSQGQLDVVLPPTALGTGPVITIGLVVDPGPLSYQGLAHFGKVLIGRKSSLDHLKHIAHDLKSSYYLWYILPRLTLCLLFCAVFLVYPRAKEAFAFAIYGFGATATMFLLTSYADAVLPKTIHGTTLYLAGDVLVQGLFLNFIVYYFRAATLQYVKLSSVAFAAAGLALGACYLWLPDAFFLDAGYWASRGLRSLALIIGIVLAKRTLATLRRNGVAPHRRFMTWSIIAIFALAMLATALETADLIPSERNPLVTFGLETTLFLVFSVSIAMSLRNAEDERARFHEEVLRQQADLRQAEVAIAVASSVQMIAHDIKKPFALLKSFIDVMGREHDPRRVQALAEAFRSDARAILTRTEDMLMDMQTSHHGALPTFSDVPFEKLVASALQTVASLSLRDDLSLRLDWDQPWILRVHAPTVVRALENLIHNAAQAADSGGHIWITAKLAEGSEPGMLAVTIGNTGSYIAEEDRANIFAAHFSKGKPGGTGLGLAIAQQIIGQHGGRISVASSRDTGTAFTALLPLAARGGSSAQNDLPQSLPKSLPKSLSAWRKQPLLITAVASKVVVIEDDAFVRELWVSAYEQDASALVMFTSPEELFAQIGSGVLPIRTCILSCPGRGDTNRPEV